MNSFKRTTHHSSQYRANPLKKRNSKKPIKPRRPRQPTGRQRGGQPGNTNHLIHGAYARHISIETQQDLRSMPEDRNQNELDLARSRLVACLEKQKDAPPEEWLAFEHAIEIYIHDIARLTHNNAILGRDRDSAFITVIEMIRQTNSQQHVR